MKLKDSIISRRWFLNSLIGGWLAALVGPILSPILKMVFPPDREPDEVLLPLSDYTGMQPNSVRQFAWGAKPGLLKRNDDGTYTAFVGVCTHLDCNIKYLPEQKKFFCACHDGWYDQSGINIKGPPPSPLRTLEVVFNEEEILIKKQAGGK